MLLRYWNLQRALKPIFPATHTPENGLTGQLGQVSTALQWILRAGQSENRHLSVVHGPAAYRVFIFFQFSHTAQN